MSYAGITSDKQRADVIAYLRTLSDNPPPLPTADEAPKPPASGQPAAAPGAAGAPAAPKP
jgi:cytochrome c